MRMIASIILALTLVACQLAALPATASELRFQVGGVERRAVLVNEPGAGTALRPAVIVLHGGRGSIDAMQTRTGFDALAVTEGFTVAYAEGAAWRGRQHAWNTGYLMRKQVGLSDDVGYFDALIDLLVRDHRIDPARVYMTGGSNGGMMTLVYAVKRPQRLAAVAPVVAAMFSFDEKPGTPLPILLINGGKDREVPLAGGMSLNPLVSRNQLAPYKPLQETVSFWVAANRSRVPPRVEIAGPVTTTTYEATPGGAVTVSVVDAEGGHGWPGTAESRADNMPIQSFNGAERIWAFFKTQRRGSVQGR